MIDLFQSNARLGYPGMRALNEFVVFLGGRSEVVTFWVVLSISRYVLLSILSGF